MFCLLAINDDDEMIGSLHHQWHARVIPENNIVAFADDTTGV